jgi:hypothetical protein
VIVPAPVGSVDPSDWGGKGSSSSPNTGWVPTGTNVPPVTVKTSGNVTTGNGDAVALVDRLAVSGLPETWDGAGSKPTAKRLAGRAPATVISAHGGWYTGNGVIRVPAGDTITTYVPIGTKMGNDLGIDVDTGNVHGADTKYLHVYKAGDLIPNFTFVHFDDTTGLHVVNPSTPTTLNALLATHHGQIWISTCEDLFVPEGESIAEALGTVAVYSPGSSTPTGSTRVTLTRQGQLAP